MSLPCRFAVSFPRRSIFGAAARAWASQRALQCGLALAAFFPVLFPLAGPAQTISVIGWDAPATSITSAVASPYGVATDFNGAIYVADTGNQRVIQLTPNGTGYHLNATIASASTQGASFKPTGVVVDQLLDVYIANQGTGSVLQFLWNGTGYSAPTTVVSGLSTTAISKIVVDGGGDVYVADPGNHRILEVPLSGTTYGSPVTIASYPSGGSAAIALDASMNLYFTDSTGGQIMQAAWSGNAYNSPVAVITGLSGVHDIAIDSTGNLYYTSAAGVSSAAWLGGASFAASFAVGGSSTFGQAWGLAFGNLGILVVSDQQSNTVSTVLPPARACRRHRG